MAVCGACERGFESEHLDGHCRETSGASRDGIMREGTVTNGLNKERNEGTSVEVNKNSRSFQIPCFQIVRSEKMSDSTKTKQYY